jgi:hypothetical protein
MRGERADADAESVREQLTEVRDSLGKLGRRVARRGGEAGKSAVASGKSKVDDTYRTLTLKEYRDEVDQALADITQVLVVLEARVRALEAGRCGE